MSTATATDPKHRARFKSASPSAYTYAMPEPIGFQKLAFVGPRLTGAALGALTGAALAPEEEGWTGAALGGLTGYGAGALASRGMNFARGLQTPKAPGAPATPAASAPTVPPGYSPQEMAAAHAEIEQHLKRPPTDPVFDAKLNAAQQARAKEVAEARAALDKLQAAKGKSPRTWNRAAQSALPYASPRLQEMAMGQPASRLNETARALQSLRAQEQQALNAPKPMPAIPAPDAPHEAWKGFKFRKVGFDKLADYGFSAGVPGFSVSTSGKDERLEGMNRWVPRRLIERAYQGLEGGLDEQALLDEAANRGHLAQPMAGAALAAALAHKLSPASHPGLKAMAGLAGGGLGALSNQAGQERRVEDMRQAIRGVTREMQRQESAREATPMVVSSTAGET